MPPWNFGDETEHKQMELASSADVFPVVVSPTTGNTSALRRLVSNGTRSSLDGPFHGSVQKFLVNGKRPLYR